MSPQSTAERAIIAVLVERRHTLGLSQRDVAKQMSVTHPLICMLESGARRPHLDTITAWAKALGLKLQLFEPFVPNADAVRAGDE